MQVDESCRSSIHSCSKLRPPALSLNLVPAEGWFSSLTEPVRLFPFLPLFYSALRLCHWSPCSLFQAFRAAITASAICWPWDAGATMAGPEVGVTSPIVLGRWTVMDVELVTQALTPPRVSTAQRVCFIKYRHIQTYLELDKNYSWPKTPRGVSSTHFSPDFLLVHVSRFTSQALWKPKGCCAVLECRHILTLSPT